MKRLLAGMAAALMTFMAGMAVATLSLQSDSEPSGRDASQPVGKSGGAASGRLDLAEVFRGFDYVASGDIAAGCACPHGFQEAQPFPPTFEAGRMYVFHNREATDTDLLFDSLEKRFHSFGAVTDVTGGNFTGNRLHPDTMLFHGDGYAGTVTFKAHRTKSKGGKEYLPWFVHDVVLTLEMQP